MKRIAVLGGGGHGRVIAALIRACEARGEAVTFAGFIDRAVTGMPGWIGTDDDLTTLRLSGQVTHAVVGVGSVKGGGGLRARLFSAIREAGLEPASLVHPAAWADPEAEIGPGSVVMAGAVVHPGVMLGANVIINTRAGIDHDGSIGAHTHIAPGATLSGDVVVGTSVLVGVGASVRQGVQIGDSATVGAGAVVVANVASGLTVVGCPARELRQTPR